jgi:NADPH:quinone reductase-like Zn-dependent oxidoreductase
MRAITQQEFGDPSVLRLVDVPIPEPAASEVLVRVAAIGINPVESFVRSGAFPLLGEPPFILGWEVSGVVEDARPVGGRFAAGDEVYGMVAFPRAGSAYAEYVTGASRHFARKPAGLTHVEAAALPLAGLTAWQGLVDYADVRPGQRVLVHGAGGGVGHLAVQLAAARGGYVLGTAAAAKHDVLRDLGADELIDYRAVAFEDVVRDVDVVFDGVGYGARSLPVLRPGGVLVTIVQHSDRELRAEVEAAGRRFVGVAVEPDHAGLEQLTALVDSGRLRPTIAAVLPLEDAAKAHELVDGGHTLGKIVLTTGSTE